jgi:hypothetical protein
MSHLRLEEREGKKGRREEGKSLLPSFLSFHPSIDSILPLMEQMGNLKPKSV